MFGGLYSIVERDQILKHFKGRSHRIEPLEFGIVAERAILLRNRQMGVAS